MNYWFIALKSIVDFWCISHQENLGISFGKYSIGPGSEIYNKKIIKKKKKYLRELWEKMLKTISPKNQI